MKKCIACHAEVDDNVDKCPMCGNFNFKSGEDNPEDIEEMPESAKKIVKGMLVLGNLFSIIMTLVVCGSFVGFGSFVLKESGIFEGKFGVEAVFALVFIGFGIFALVSMVRSIIANRQKIKDIDDENGL